MNKYISSDWIGKSTAEVSKYTKDVIVSLAFTTSAFFDLITFSRFFSSFEQLETEIKNDTFNTFVDNFASSFRTAALSNEQITEIALKLKTDYEKILATITEMLLYSGVKEPISSITGIYYTRDLKINSQIQVENGITYKWPFTFMSVSCEQKEEPQINSSTQMPIVKQKINLSFDYENFRTNFLNSTNNNVEVLLFYYMFIVAIRRIINRNTKIGNSNYIHFSRHILGDDVEGNNELFSPKASLKSEYNFYVKDYETLFNKDYSLLQVLPNYYLLNSYINSEEEQIIKNLVSLNDRLDVTEQTILSQQYYSDFSKTISSMTNSEIREVTSKTQNYLIDVDYSNKTKLALSDEMLPYNIKLVFSNDPSDTISSFLNSNNLQTLFANNIFGSLEDSSLNTTLITQDKNQTNKTIQARTAKYLDAIKFDYSSQQAGFYLKPNKLTLISKNTRPSITGASSLFTYIKMNTKLYEIYNNLNFCNIFSCAPNDSFCCGYIIEKYEINPQGRGNLYQTIVMARDNSVSDYEIIDSQVVYDKTIKYVIHALQMAPNNKYMYFLSNDGLKTSESKQQSINLVLDGTIEPDLSFYKIEIKDSDATVVDNPPLPPDVNIVPFIGVNNALRFLFNTQYGSYIEKPIVITEKDQTIFDSIKTKQKATDKVYFETDDFINTIQIFRSTTIPSSYIDFRNSLYRILSMNTLTANSFIDIVQPNQKYYYIFRSTDIHGNVSNPSSVFEVHMIDDSGAIYPIIRTIPLIEKENYDIVRTFKKYINITPSINQTAFVPNQDNTQITFGESSDLWGQKFKIRVTSKKTGKSFDLNVTFNKEEKSL